MQDTSELKQLIDETIDNIYTYGCTHDNIIHAQLLIIECLNLSSYDIYIQNSIYMLLNLLKQSKISVFNLQMQIQELELKLIRLCINTDKKNINVDNTNVRCDKTDNMTDINNTTDVDVYGDISCIIPCDHLVNINNQLIEQSDLKTCYIGNVYSQINGIVKDEEEIKISPNNKIERRYTYNIYEDAEDIEHPIFNIFGQTIYNKYKEDLKSHENSIIK